MRTSESRPASGALPVRTIALEALAVAALALGVSALLAPADVGMGAHALRPHPIWLAIALMAARYGTRGLAAGLICGWVLTVGAAAALRVPMPIVEARIASGPDLGALLGVILIGWVASIHERRARELGMALAALEEFSASDKAALAALRSTAVVLRARADRLDTSLTFLRDVAARLEGGDSTAAAQAALDLASARLGARLGWVAIADGERLMPVASTGPWAPLPQPRADRTVAAALRLRRPARALDLSDGTAGDSDLAAPILTGEGGDVVGVIVLRGVPQGGASAAALHDLSLIAGWSARALSARRFAAPLHAAAGAGIIDDVSAARIDADLEGEGELDRAPADGTATSSEADGATVSTLARFKRS
jgi:hypothetical protein